MAEISAARRKKLLRRKKKLKESSGKGAFIFPKPNETIRFRPLPVPEDEEFGMEVIQFYLGQEIKGVISPKSVGEPCALYEKWLELKDSEDEDDKSLASKLSPKKKYIVPVIRKKDKAGLEVDKSTGVRMILLAGGAYQQMVDLFLDPEQGDFTHPREGYDIKLTRTGAGQFDTKYSTIPCKPSKTPQEYRTIINLKEMLQKALPTYKETKEILNRFLGLDEDDDRPRKKKKKSSKYEE